MPLFDHSGLFDRPFNFARFAKSNPADLGKPSTILFPAEKGYFGMYEQSRLQALGDFFSRTPSSPPNIHILTVPLPEVIVEMGGTEGYEEGLRERIPTGVDDSTPVA